MDVLLALKTNLLSVVMAVLGVLLLWKSRSKSRYGRLPPGPRPLPLVGNMFDIGVNEAYKYYMELSKKYGSVVTIWLSTTPVVIISGYHALKETMIGLGEEFSGRSNYPLIMKATLGYGVLSTSGHRWREMRRFSIMTLKHFGMGRRSIEQKVQDEAKNLVKMIKKREGKHHELFRNLEKAREFCRREAKARINNVEDPSCPQDLIEAFVLKMEEEKDKTDTEYHFENLVSVIWNIFSAGTETTSSTIRHALLVMMKHPDVQERVQKEIDEIIGQERYPSTEDRQNLPYTDAVLHEIQRSMDLTPISVPHKMMCDTEYNGYVIPEGTTVFPLLCSVLADPELWKNPNCFDPENFLDENGRFKKNVAFVVFGMGKRACPGEALARLEYFIMFTTLLQRFTFKATVPPEELDISPANCSFGRLPRKYECYAFSRT